MTATALTITMMPLLARAAAVHRGRLAVVA